MRVFFIACAAAATLAAAPLPAVTLSPGELLPARLTVYLDPVFGLDGAVTAFSDNLGFDLPIANNSFRGQLRGILGQGDDDEVGELAFDLAVSGEIFPVISFLGNFTDFGAASTFAITASLPIPAITGPATYQIAGTIENPERNGTPVTLASGQPAFFGHFVNGVPLASLGFAPVAPGTTLSETGSGAFDCSLAPGGSCIQMTSMFVGVGPGDGQTFRISSTFDIDADSIAPVPLPASFSLLLAGLGGLGVAARRQRPRTA